MQNQTQTHEPPWTILSILKWTTSYFKSRHIENPRASAEVLLAHVLGLARIDLYIRYDLPLNPDELARFKSAVRRRVRREPVAYIVGEKEFWSLPITVAPDVLIPRPETECLVEAALALLPPSDGNASDTRPPIRILDLGTGSGAIILALASELKTAFLAASDRSTKALRIAQRNARRLGFGHRIHFFCGDWFACMHTGRRQFDMIVSNPPYIPASEIAGLAPEVSRYEPRRALDGGADGLAAIFTIIDRAPDYLRPGGRLLLEIGHDQRPEVERKVAGSTAYVGVDFGRDYSGYDRIAKLVRK